jgi:hypothetical protein
MNRQVSHARITSTGRDSVPRGRSALFYFTLMYLRGSRPALLSCEHGSVGHLLRRPATPTVIFGEIGWPIILKHGFATQV